MGESQNWGYLFGGPNNEDYIVYWGLYWGTLILRNYHIYIQIQPTLPIQLTSSLQAFRQLAKKNGAHLLASLRILEVAAAEGAWAVESR